MRRTTISLSDDQERALARFAEAGPYQDELRVWARERGIELNDSPAEAALVRVLIDAGVEHIRAYSADVAYRELAEVYVDEGIAGEVTALGGDPSGAGTPIGGASASGATGHGATTGSGASRGAVSGTAVAVGRSRGSRDAGSGPR
jgi:hypothetical protein